MRKRIIELLYRVAPYVAILSLFFNFALFLANEHLRKYVDSLFELNETLCQSNLLLSNYSTAMETRARIAEKSRDRFYVEFERLISENDRLKSELKTLNTTDAAASQSENSEP